MLLVAGRVSRRTALGPMLIVGSLGVFALHRSGLLGG